MRSNANQEPSERAEHEFSVKFEMLLKIALRKFKGQERVQQNLDVALFNYCFNCNAINSVQQTLFSSI